MFTERVEQELALLRQRYEDVEYVEAGHWVRVGKYPLPKGWNRQETDVVFQIQRGHPGQAPYGIYLPVGLQFGTTKLTNYAEPAPAQPPFSGRWGIFSWTPEDWKPAADPTKGSNLLNWVISFAERFREGA